MVKQILAILKELYPRARIELDFGSVFQLVVAVILSAQCTDVRVNKVTPKLFERFPDAEAMAAAPLLEIEKLIFSTGFYRAKAQNIQAMAQSMSGMMGQAPAAPAAPAEMPIEERLAKLKGLLDKGLISAADYDSTKAELLKKLIG